MTIRASRAWRTDGALHGEPNAVTGLADPRASQRGEPLLEGLSSFRCNFFLFCYLRPALRRPSKTSDAVKLSSCLGDFLRRGGEGDRLGVVLAGEQAVVQAAEQAAEQVALGSSVPVAVVTSPVVVGAGAG